MVAMFKERDFLFYDHEECPEHIDDSPEDGEGDPNKWHLELHEGFDGERYPLAIDIDSSAVAGFLATAAYRRIRVNQPTTSGFGSVQDRVYVISPVVAAP